MSKRHRTPTTYENGIIQWSKGVVKRKRHLKVLPMHSCIAVDVMPYYLTIEGEEIDIWDKK